MIFQENCLLADNSREIAYLIFFQKLGKMSQNLSPAAVVIGTLRVKLIGKRKKNKIFLDIEFTFTYGMRHVNF